MSNARTFIDEALETVSSGEDFVQAMADIYSHTEVRDDGIYDVEKQKELSAKYEQIDMIKKELSEKLTELTEIIIS